MKVRFIGGPKDGTSLDLPTPLKPWFDFPMPVSPVAEWNPLPLSLDMEIVTYELRKGPVYAIQGYRGEL